MAVGFINEPVFVGDRSGLEFFVSQNGQPVEGLESTVKAEVIQGGNRRDLPVSRRFGEAGAYQSYFFPTVAGAYTFHLTGTLPDGSSIDQCFSWVAGHEPAVIPSESSRGVGWRPKSEAGWLLSR